MRNTNGIPSGECNVMNALASKLEYRPQTLFDCFRLRQIGGRAGDVRGGRRVGSFEPINGLGNLGGIGTGDDDLGAMFEACFGDGVPDA